MRKIRCGEGGRVEEDGDRAIERAKIPHPPLLPGRIETDGQRTHGGEADGNESLIVAGRRWANKHGVTTLRGVDRIYRSGDEKERDRVNTRGEGWSER